MLRRVSAALRRLDLQPIQRRWSLLRQISTFHAPLAAPLPSGSDSYPFPLKKRATMARRIPPTKPDNFSESEPDEEEFFSKEIGDEHLEEGEEEEEAEEGGDGKPEVLGWMLEYNGHSESDSAPAEEEEKGNK